MPYEESSEIISSLKKAWVNPERPGHAIPTYRLMDKDGKILNKKEMPNVF